MTVTAHSIPPRIERSVRLYRALLVAYPRGFRDEYGDDLVQGYRDLLLFGAGHRAGWWATTRDLVTSAVRERGSALAPGGRPPWGALFAVLAGVLAMVFIGPGGFLFPFIAIPAMLLVGLPVLGLTQFHRAWVVRRTTGGPIARRVILGIASFAPVAAALVWLGDDAGWFIFAAISLSVIAASALGTVWALAMLIERRGAAAGRRWKRPLLVLVPCLLVLGVIIGASYNSYRNSLGPPGDHSVQNASAVTEALWAAAGRGDLDEVVDLAAESCADPWVKFAVGDGRHNAKGFAEVRGLTGAAGPYGEIADVLGEYMDTWYDDCGRSKG
jgi:hypothetical protein